MRIRCTHKRLFILSCLVAANMGLGHAAWAETAGKRAPDPARAAGMVAHKALYKIKMVKRKAGTLVSDVTGQMLYEWQPYCDAWISNTRFNMTYDYMETPPLHLTSDFTFHETFDGKGLTFSTQRKKDGNLFEEFRGSAKNENGTIKAVYSIPKGLEHDLPSGTLFPVSHTLEVLKKAKAGEHIFNAMIFDGSDDQGAVQLNTFIGKEADITPYLKDSPEFDKSLVNTKAWNLRLAYFPENNEENIPEYEMNVVFHENGVISHMLIEYHDFSVEQTLVAIEPLGDACDNTSADGQKGKDKPEKP